MCGRVQVKSIKTKIRRKFQAVKKSLWVREKQTSVTGLHPRHRRITIMFTKVQSNYFHDDNWNLETQESNGELILRSHRHWKKQNAEIRATEIFLTSIILAGLFRSLWRVQWNTQWQVRGDNQILWSTMLFLMLWHSKVEEYVCFEASQNSGKSNRALQVGTEVYHQIFAGGDVQTMWN